MRVATETPGPSPAGANMPSIRFRPLMTRNLHGRSNSAACVEARYATDLTQHPILVIPIREALARSKDTRGSITAEYPRVGFDVGRAPSPMTACCQRNSRRHVPKNHEPTWYLNRGAFPAQVSKRQSRYINDSPSFSIHLLCHPLIRAPNNCAQSKSFEGVLPHDSPNT